MQVPAVTAVGCLNHPHPAQETPKLLISKPLLARDHSVPRSRERLPQILEPVSCVMPHGQGDQELAELRAIRKLLEEGKK